jgi:hypothetical protein
LAGSSERVLVSVGTGEEEEEEEESEGYSKSVSMDGTKVECKEAMAC